MSKPCYEIDQETRKIILELKRKCIELYLGNINFRYYNVTKFGEEIKFHLTECKYYWELVVMQRWAKTADIYRIEEGSLNYQYSEKD